jgi:hypothetical protein
MSLVSQLPTPIFSEPLQNPCRCWLMMMLFICFQSKIHSPLLTCATPCKPLGLSGGPDSGRLSGRGALDSFVKM